MKKIISIFSLLCIFGLTACELKDDDNKSDATELEGSWISTDAESKSKDVFKFSGNDYTITQTFYSDSNYTQEACVIVYKGTFKIGNEIASVAGSKELDLVMKTETATAKNNDGVAILNADDDFSSENWEVNMTVENTYENYSWKTIFTIKDNKLLFGDDGTSPNEDSYPTKLDESEEYIKQGDF